MTRFATIVMTGLLLAAGTAAGGVLLNEGMPAWRGTETYDPGNMFPGATSWWTADVDHTVYEPGTFSFTVDPGHTPKGSHYVYAYQIVDVSSTYGGYVTQLSVGLNMDGDATECIWYVQSDPGDVDPSTCDLAPFTARWTYSPELAVGQVSSVMYFSSPYAPWDDTSTLSGYMGADTQYVPSPYIPEPGALSLLALGICALLRRRSAQVMRRRQRA
jgi:hypothetical protein